MPAEIEGWQIHDKNVETRLGDFAEGDFGEKRQIELFKERMAYIIQKSPLYNIW